MCRGKKTNRIQDQNSTLHRIGSDDKTARQDLGSLESHDITLLQDLRYKASHHKIICEIQDP